MTRWWLVVAVFACSSQKREPATATESPPPVVAVITDATLTPDADPFTGYPDRALRPTSPCMLRGEWNDQPEELRLTATGKPFAKVFGVKQAEITLAAAAAFADVSTDTLELSGFVDAKLLALHAAKPFVVAGYAVPAPKVTMRFVAEREGKVTFELPLPESAKAKAPLRSEQPCGALAIDDNAEFEARAAIDAPTESEANLRPKRAIPLSIEFGKPPVVELRYDESPRVDVLEKREKHARVAIEINSLNPANHVVLFGWVPATALFQDPHGFGGSWASGGGGGARRSRPLKDTKFVACDAETPLAVDFEGARKSVGTITPRVVIEVLPGTDAFATVRFPKPTAELVEGARWLVKQSALAGCSPVAAP